MDQEGKSDALRLHPVQELAATIGYAAAKRLRPSCHLFGTILWCRRVTAIKMSVRVAIVAL